MNHYTSDFIVVYAPKRNALIDTICSGFGLTKNYGE